MTATSPRPPRRLTQRLSAAFVRTAAPGFYCDGHGLNLRVDPSGARQWVQRLVIQGRPRMLGLGGYPLVSLAEARNAAFANRQRARAGGDPLAEKRHGQGVPTVEEAAAEVLAQQRPSWRNAKHARDWPRSLRAYAFPRIGALPVSDVTTADVLAILTPIWHDKPETARRVRQRIGAVMKWAVASQQHDVDPLPLIADLLRSPHAYVLEVGPLRPAPPGPLPPPATPGPWPHQSAAPRSGHHADMPHRRALPGTPRHDATLDGLSVIRTRPWGRGPPRRRDGAPNLPFTPTEAKDRVQSP